MSLKFPSVMAVRYEVFWGAKDSEAPKVRGGASIWFLATEALDPFAVSGGSCAGLPGIVCLEELGSIPDVVAGRASRPSWFSIGRKDMRAST